MSFIKVRGADDKSNVLEPEAVKNIKGDSAEVDNTPVFSTGYWFKRSITVTFMWGAKGMSILIRIYSHKQNAYDYFILRRENDE